MQQAFDQQTIEDLEFNQIQNWLKDLAFGPTATKNLQTLRPSNRYESVDRELKRVFDLFRIKTEHVAFPSLEFQELQSEIKLLEIRNAVLEEEGFVKLLNAAKLGNALVKFRNARSAQFPFLCQVVNELEHNDNIPDSIHEVFDEKGQVKDKASEALETIRQQQLVVKNRSNRNFDKELRKLTKEQVLADISEAYIDNRRVLAVVSTYKRSVSGQVLSSSKSGSITFIEPASTVQLNREYDILLDEERTEIRKILQMLTSKIATDLALIQSYQRIFPQMDVLQAKARLAVTLNCTLPNINRDGSIELIDAYHPILWRNNEQQNKTTIAQHITLNRQSRMLVISGPNAGGKSITLKTVGLLQLMLQSGLLVPVHPNSKMIFFQQILSDIGDNQSIANELSTYSYRLKRMDTFLQRSNKATLLLLDEFGTGSDPDLGGALAEVFFEELYNKKSFGVITTHYANIKLKANQLKNAVNGCMLFDTETLAPLYRFSVGQPGSSFTFEVAQINGIPLELIEKAKGRIEKKRVEMDQLLHGLQKEKTYLEGLNQAHIEAQEIAENARVRSDEKAEKFHQKLTQLNATVERNQQYIQMGKKMKAFIDQMNVKSKKKSVNNALIEDIVKYVKMEKSKIVGEQLTQQLKKRAQNKPSAKKTKKIQNEHQQNKIVVGSKVKLIATKQAGIVEEIDGDNITVAFGFARMKVSRNKLSFLQ